MNIRMTAYVLFLLLLVPGISRSADVSGRLLYDDLPLSDTFTDISAVQINAYPWENGDPVAGTVDLAGSTYRVSGLDAVHYSIHIYLDRTAPVSEIWNAGDLKIIIDVTPQDSSSVLEIDGDLRYITHVLSPIDSALPLDGSGFDCATFPTATYPITFSIEEVPRATSYQSVVYLNQCPGGYVGAIRTTSTVPSVEIDWGSEEEDFQTLKFDCVGASGKPLCGGGVFQYNDRGVWALYLRNSDSSARSLHHHDAMVIPATAATPGAGGTYWSSSLSITNLQSRDRQLKITFTPRAKNGLDDFLETTITLGPNSQISWSDVLGDLFSKTGAGALEIRGTELAVTSRTSTPDGQGGSYGQGIPPIQPAQILSSDGVTSATIGGVEEGTTFRTNLGLCEIWGESVSVTVTVFDHAMNTLGSADYDLRPYENIQVNQVAHEIGGAGDLADGIVTVSVTSGDGRIGAYISVIDNSSGDPTFVTVAPQSTIGE